MHERGVETRNSLDNVNSQNGPDCILVKKVTHNLPCLLAYIEHGHGNYHECN